MTNAISNFLWSMWEIAGQLPNEYGGVVEKDGRFLYEKMEAIVPTASENNPYRIPRDVLALIIRRSLPSALGSVNLVCKLWYQIASTDALWQSCHLAKLFPKAPVVDEEVWDTYIDLEKHGLTFEKKGRPYIRNKREYLEIKRMGSAVEDGLGFTILTLPKGLSVNKIVAFAAAPKQGNSTGFTYLSPAVIADLGDKEIEETATLVITNGIFKGSRWRPWFLLRSLAKGLQCEVPGASAVMALAIVRFISSRPDAPIRLFGFDPIRFTLCEENISFGSFASPGPHLNRNYFAHEGHGVGGLRKLAVLDH